LNAEACGIGSMLMPIYVENAYRKPPVIL
jgi:hypothetical protein